VNEVVTFFHGYHYDAPDEVYDGVRYWRCSCGESGPGERGGWRHAKAKAADVHHNHSSENDI
jgi:hypothetical protein